MAIRGPTGDPRIEIDPPAEAGVRPVVALPRPGVSTVAMIGGAVLAGLLLFTILDARRRDAAAPAVRPRASEMQTGTAPPPPLFIPAERPVVIVEDVQPAPAPPPPRQPPAPRIVYVPQPVPSPSPVIQNVDTVPQRSAASGPVLVVDTSAPAPTAVAGQGAAASSSPGTTSGTARARSGMFANNATTVPQGTIIQAVLETALDSTRPGFARAIVSRDVRGFDGTRVLIPRGSRLVGEYRSDAAPGQRRALVNWVRLIRPDGVTIAIGSPAADPLGRGGIRARVDTHFFERFAGAILQSSFDIGIALATRNSGVGSTIVLLPGAVQGVADQATQIIPPQQITNTLSVRQGTSISIFAARDLDFTGTEQQR
ncbi:TrbI/VirB10 family protein [Sphingomonas sp. SUN039]|uniref:TrbI/VirB10 family protein n=1 Tax=Sphingomonas sp. SUN039 TaxID=2937787 RepID=UPI002164C232|nr:TrbI/VirB10 family protein [Sphingomonas sp. SUN039]UVO52821.1 conjugal transfer protein TrbI [Sphingomonas sp. SUN039]